MQHSEIKTCKAPQPVGPYSQALDLGDFVFTSGQIGTDPETGRMPEDVREQTRQVMENLRAVLAAADLDFGSVVKASIYITDLGDFDAMNAVYAGYFTEPYPARCCVEVSRMSLGAKVEITLVARRP